jgi:hypothetical protein
MDKSRSEQEMMREYAENYMEKIFACFFPRRALP